MGYVQIELVLVVITIAWALVFLNLALQHKHRGIDHQSVVPIANIEITRAMWAISVDPAQPHREQEVIQHFDSVLYEQQLIRHIHNDLVVQLSSLDAYVDIEAIMAQAMKVIRNHCADAVGDSAAICAFAMFVHRERQIQPLLRHNDNNIVEQLLSADVCVDIAVSIAQAMKVICHHFATTRSRCSNTIRFVSNVRARPFTVLTHSLSLSLIRTFIDLVMTMLFAVLSALDYIQESLSPRIRCVLRVHPLLLLRFKTKVIRLHFPLVLGIDTFLVLIALVYLEVFRETRDYVAIDHLANYCDLGISGHLNSLSNIFGIACLIWLRRVHIVVLFENEVRVATAYVVLSLAASCECRWQYRFASTIGSIDSIDSNSHVPCAVLDCGGTFRSVSSVCASTHRMHSLHLCTDPSRTTKWRCRGFYGCSCPAHSSRFGTLRGDGADTAE